MMVSAGGAHTCYILEGEEADSAQGGVISNKLLC